MDTETIVLVVAIFIALIIYFLPTIIASQRNHNSAGLIFFVNLFVGWTVVVWLITLIWASEGKTKEEMKKKD
ncbi:MAG: superinfection immunity protein [Endomicrobia bacterium]|nr:superinfection immunity protein [Endomicrobiia bacterium]